MVKIRTVTTTLLTVVIMQSIHYWKDKFRQEVTVAKLLVSSESAINSSSNLERGKNSGYTSCPLHGCYQVIKERLEECEKDP